jgi:hypothetical protein
MVGFAEMVKQLSASSAARQRHGNLGGTHNFSTLGEKEDVELLAQSEFQRSAENTHEPVMMPC